ncbi:MAG: response regulator [Leptospirillum sp.]
MRAEDERVAMGMRISTEKKIFLGFGIAVAALAISAFMAFRTAGSYLQSAEWVAHTQKVLRSLDTAWALINEAESDQRAYLLTSSPFYLRERQDSIRHLERVVDGFPKTVTDNPLEERRALEIREHLQMRLQILDSVLSIYREKGLGAAQALLRAGAGIGEMTAIHDLVNKMHGTEKNLLRERTEASRVAGEETLWVIAAAAIFLMALLGGLFWRIRAEMDDRLEAENALEESLLIEKSQGKILSLFSGSSSGLSWTLKTVLEILAEDHPFPISAFYRYDEWQGAFLLEAHKGTDDRLEKSFHRGEGILGEAAMADSLQRLKQPGDTPGLLIRTGIYQFLPVEIAMIPVRFQEQRFGVIVLGAIRTISDREASFLEKLSLQLGAALNSFFQKENQQIMASELRAHSGELLQKNQMLRMADQAKSDFLANMSHELRTPLNAVIGFSELLKDGVLGGLAPEQEEAALDIFESGQHLLSLINDILDLSKVEAGMMKLELEATDLQNLLQNALGVVREKATAHQISLSIEVGPDFPPMVLDQRKTKQILYNLLSNAVKFNVKGGRVILRAQRHSDLKKPEFSDFPTWLEISVTDTGIGISNKDLDRLFQPFVQVDSGLDRHYEGTGLGLSLLKRMVELHGGRVSVESVLGEGSTFHVWLPWRTDIEDHEILLAPALPRNKSDRMTLVIESDDESSLLLERYLADDGFRVRRSKTAMEGLATARQEKPDLIILEMNLPDMDGWDFLLAQRNDELLSGIPVVITTMDSREGSGFSLGSVQVLQKPVDTNELKKILNKLGLSSSQKERHLILVVDDDAHAVEILRRQLTNGGYEVLSAYGGQDAVLMARNFHPELILLDLMMPDFSGFDVVEALQSDRSTNAIPVIVLTAKVITAEDRRRLNGSILQILEKAGFQSDRFLGEVYRALSSGVSVQEKGTS